MEEAQEVKTLHLHRRVSVAPDVEDVDEEDEERANSFITRVDVEGEVKPSFAKSASSSSSGCSASSGSAVDDSDVIEAIVEDEDLTDGERKARSIQDEI